MPEKDKTESVPTERVILRREAVLVLPESMVGEKIDHEKLAEAFGIPKAQAAKLVSTLAWIEVDRQANSSKTKAIEQYAGKPGTPDAKPGVYKAPSVRAFAEGEVYERPPEPEVKRKPLEE